MTVEEYKSLNSNTVITDADRQAYEKLMSNVYNSKPNTVQQTPATTYQVENLKEHINNLNNELSNQRNLTFTFLTLWLVTIACFSIYLVLKNTNFNKNIPQDTMQQTDTKEPQYTQTSLTDILRYIFTIPCAILGCILGATLLPYAFTIYSDKGSFMYDAAYYITSNIAFVLVPLYILYFMPPHKHRKIVSGIGIVYSSAWIITLIFEIIFSTFTLKDLGNGVIQIISIISFLLCIYSNDIADTFDKKTSV